MKFVIKQFNKIRTKFQSGDITCNVAMYFHVTCASDLKLSSILHALTITNVKTNLSKPGIMNEQLVR